jgi:PAB1-binding protein PBP1
MVEDDNSSTPEVSEEPWDQFKENSKLGVKSTYTFEKYTTEIDTSDPDYLKNLRKGIEVERAMQGEATTDLHILEERHGIVTETLNEEERYSEVLDSEPAPVTVSLQASSETKEKPPEREGEAVKSLPQQDEITSVPPSDAAESKGTEKDLSKDFVLSTEKK